MDLKFVESNLITHKANNEKGRGLELSGILTDGQGNDVFVRWLDNDGGGKVDTGDAFVTINAQSPKPDGYGTEREGPSRDLYEQLKKAKPETDIISFQQRFGQLLEQRVQDTFTQVKQTSRFMENLFNSSSPISRNWTDPYGCWDYEYNFEKGGQTTSVQRSPNGDPVFGSRQFPFAENDNRHYDVVLNKSEEGVSSIFLLSYRAGGEHGCNRFGQEAIGMSVKSDSPDANLFAGAWIFSERTPPPTRPRHQ